MTIVPTRSVRILVADDDRLPVLEALATMPAEAWGWVVLTLTDAPLETGRGQVWPDGLGGFMRESQEAIQKTRAAARKFAGLPETPKARMRHPRLPRVKP